ncbi:hypothetical protein [Candidatus Brocadia sinica]|uniref:Uncharacterized protein n=1 Tax=Candidatus Brocadia sinica JPN1 TaxID=1197129 RepID=A0ABQ0JW05_9BACT|nr:hypothetical protein [Candidatus Brocadia sinica]MBL1167265.1 hypothetical protein [Candidatus Brocadia sp. AMX1]NOG41261.1 hypothetical protein [Planctomycetota bacterium]GAN32903.1 hypothetical protein BROSI_A1418 [Candidatus Brocadia sinica JPN1]GIK14523.1 MAG: hypothetical protein BroJett002_32300 [Candidatus Brocadia sinica]GJQ16210.1 MAG: hypothetical protein HBSIN01_01690 [Candidatus Brocadia sinica]
MNENITLTKTALVNLLDAVPYPNPDDPWGQYGTIGPVAQALRDLSWALLNPQPLPPGASPHPDPWRYGPGPQPWYAAFLSRAVIDRAVTQYQLAEVSGNTEQSKRITTAIGSQIREFVDD